MGIWGKKYLKNAGNLKNSSVTIGIIGSSNGVGTTHLAIMLAGFISSKEHRKTALIELNHAGTFSALNSFGCDEDVYFGGIDESFNLNGVDYYSVRTEAEYAGIFQKGYEYIIIDLGCEWDRNLNELLRCDTGCVVGSLSEWKIAQFEKCIYRLQKLADNKSFNYMAALGMQGFKKDIERKYHIEIKTIPFEPTPFLLHRETFAFFESLCGRI